MFSKTAQLHKPSKSTKKNLRRRLIKQLDDLVREIVCKNKVCVCCGKYSELIQPGHYITRKVYALRWDLRNVAPQCPGCNLRHNFDPSKYSSWMLKTYGNGIFDELQTIKNQSPKITTTYLLELVETLKEKV